MLLKQKLITDFPTDDSQWDEIPLEEFENYRDQWNVPLLDMDTVTAFNDISLGNYW